ncbi:MAG TPA: serine/threonine-protein kinase [Euzebyales bacterium]|nr:serine/threonine-protein kinase [Euzebyales bacterium]
MVTTAPSREDGLLGGRYVLEGLIGRGGMAEVYRAHDLVLARVVAVKLLRTVAVDEEDRARFTDEARTLARLSHPNLVTILDAAIAGDVPYQVMELVDGPSLEQCCRAGPLEPARVAVIGAQIADALGHVHAAGIVHRDLKPGNVLLRADTALLTDFGVARLLSAAARHTITGATVGTPAYLAPEQVRGEAVGPATDVYGLGLVLLEALTGRRAYRGAPVEAALARLTTPPSISDAVPTAWHELLRAMTALDPTERPSTAAVAATLRGLASGLDPAAATAVMRSEAVAAAPLPGRGGGDSTTDSATRELEAPVRSRRVPTRWLWAVGAATAVSLMLTAAAVGGDQRYGGTDVRDNVPPALQEPLQDLHEAVNGST